jgi:hypothetical protein
MEIKEARVPSELRFAQQANPAIETGDESGIPVVYVLLLCGSSIVITILIFHLREKKRQKGNLFMDFRSQIR